ncbi:MAG: DNA polymerase III subunit beta [Pirellulales bacterium]|jgi:DNA polymerase-3 subunit beta
MKITFDRNQMLSAFSIAASVTPTRTPKVILQNVKVETTGEGICLMATDSELGVRVQLPEVVVEAPGSCLLPVQRFMSILRESVDSQMRLSSDEKATVVKGDRSQFRLSSANADEFPSLASVREERCHQVSGRLFHELVQRTSFATDTESSRYALAGVLLEFGENSIVAVGTDGRRLAKMEGPAVSHGKHHLIETITIVPTRAIQLMSRAFSNPEAEIRITARGNDILVQDARVTIFARLVEGRFPRWRDVFPDRQGAHRIDLTVGPVLNGLKQAAVVVSDESRAVQFQFQEGTLILSAETAEVGESRVELPVSYSGEPLSISLDPRYVGDFLKVLDAERTFSLELESGESAALFSTEDGYGYVVMPMARDR